MKYRMLGKTGINVSEIGYGTWGLGGDAYGPTDDDESTRALQRAFEQGVNFFDTADLYGQGHSETILGQVFRKKRSEVIFATKGGTLPHKGFHMPQDFSSKYLQSAIEASMKRLKTDYIDLYQLHSPEIQILNENSSIIETLVKFQEEGKIRTYGISVRSPNDGLFVIKNYNIPVVQVNFNLIDQRALDNHFFDLAQETQTGVIVRTPLVFGFLTGQINAKTEFCERDHRSNWPKEQLNRWARSNDLFSFLWKMGSRTQTQTMLRFCLDQKGTSTVIPGMLNQNEVLENISASHIKPFSSIEIEKIRSIYQSYSFYDNKSKENA